MVQGYLLKNKTSEEVVKNIGRFIENFGVPKILQTDNGTEFKNNLLDTYCNNNEIKLIHSSPYHPKTNGVCEAVHKEIRKYIYNEFIKKDGEFNIEDALFEITKIHNNKIHTTTKRIPKEIRDITDIDEIIIINNEIKKTLEAKNKDFCNLDFDSSYVFDLNKTYENKGKIYKKKGKIDKNKICKIPVKVICEIVEGEEYVVEISKTIKNFTCGDTYIISMDLLEKVSNLIWRSLIQIIILIIIIRKFNNVI